VLAYLASKEQFLKDAPTIEDIVERAVQKNLGMRVSESEKRSWQNSLGNAMSNAMRAPSIPDNAIVAIEYKLNFGKFRVDFLIAGMNSERKESLLIIELKQWTDIQFSDANDHVRTIFRGTLQDTPHPSYQASSYKHLLQSRNEYIYTTRMEVSACAYLHNCRTSRVVSDPRFSEIILNAPIFLFGQVNDLQDLVKSKISEGAEIDLMRRVDSSAMRPSKQLADVLGPMLEGNAEFVLIDDQKTIFEKILLASRTIPKNKKKVVIVKGGPGTGKSVIAINALAKLSGLRLNCLYVTPNAAPRDVFKWKLRGVVSGFKVNELFSGSAVFTEIRKNTYDVLLVDEAHRLKLRSQYSKNGVNQIAEIINSTQISVFFIDESQKVTWQDIGEISAIKTFAIEVGAEIEELELTSQFRCGGSDGYVDWLDNALGVRVEVDHNFDRESFDFKIVESPKRLHEIIREKNQSNNKSRVVAGYCWDWVSKKDRTKTDIRFPEFDFEADWNLSKHGGAYLVEDSIEQIGCIHTCQGLELDYVGVIIGPDLVVTEGELVTNPLARAKTDQSLKGYKKEFKENPALASAKADEIIRNTYRTLMTRGMKGCYVYFTDQATADYFRELLPA